MQVGSVDEFKGLLWDHDLGSECVRDGVGISTRIKNHLPSPQE